jgi:hypothetical protein
LSPLSLTETQYANQPQTMDEVDFTILAATSVLGDLIEKCPPAEACRDAFDRMSKATVQMCMSTTGFGSSAGALNTRRRSHHHNQGSPESNTNNDHFNGIKQFRQQSRGAPAAKSRPVPQFDMALNDLLGSGSEIQVPTQPPFRPGSRNSASGGVKPELEPYSTSATPSRPNTNANTNMQSPSDYAISPPLSSLDTSQIDPSLLPSPTATGQYAQQVQSTYSQNPYQEMQFDFLQQPGGWNGVVGEGGGAGVGGDGQWSGDLGMGLGWDVGGEHDFSEGGNGGVDLFDGFFFGGTGNF